MSIPPTWNRKLRFVGNTGMSYSTGLEKKALHQFQDPCTMQENSRNIDSNESNTR